MEPPPGWQPISPVLYIRGAGYEPSILAKQLNSPKHVLSVTAYRSSLRDRLSSDVCIVSQPIDLRLEELDFISR
jgi:hypothetical protein